MQTCWLRSIGSRPWRSWSRGLQLISSWRVGRPLLVIVVVRLAVVAPAGALTFGSTLAAASQSNGTCSRWFGQDSCLLWSDPNFLFAPASGTVTTVRVRTGATGGRMGIVVMTGQYQQDFSTPGALVTFVCCFIKAYGPVFDVVPNAVTTVRTSLRMVEQPPPAQTIINPTFSSDDDFLALSVLDPNTSVPVVPDNVSTL